MKKLVLYFVPVVSYFMAFLFVYAAANKIWDFENFQVQLAQSPLLSAYAGFISYAVIGFELIIAVLLCLNVTRMWGLYASFGLMMAFTVYIYLILNYSDFIPCSCGGILEKMGWAEHLIFNIVCVLIILVALIILWKERAYVLRRMAFRMVLIAVMASGSVVALFLSSEHIIKKENNFRGVFRRILSTRKNLLIWALILIILWALVVKRFTLEISAAPLGFLKLTVYLRRCELLIFNQKLTTAFIK